MSISTDLARRTLILVFGLSLVIQLASLSLSLIFGDIYADELKDIFVKLLSIYSIPLGVIAAGIFSQLKSKKRAVPTTSFWLAVALGGIWNTVLLSRTLIFTFAEQDSIASLLAYYDQITAAATFLTSTSLTYFFGDSATKG